VNADEIKKYWGERAGRGLQATTNDVYMKAIEYSVLKHRIDIYRPPDIIDIGCGDGKTTIELARNFQGINFVGIDNALPMIEQAKLNAKGLQNVNFMGVDVLNFTGDFGMAITVRCIINLASWEDQLTAFGRIHNSLRQGGIYLMIENFTSGHKAMNYARKLCGLKEIPIRNHNIFLPEAMKGSMHELFELVKDINISSAYYMATRCVYAKVCADEGIEPDYLSPYHRYAARLPFAGDYGPIRLLVWRKK